MPEVQCWLTAKLLAFIPNERASEIYIYIGPDERYSTKKYTSDRTMSKVFMRQLLLAVTASGVGSVVFQVMLLNEQKRITAADRHARFERGMTRPTGSVWNVKRILFSLIQHNTMHSRHYDTLSTKIHAHKYVT